MQMQMEEDVQLSSLTRGAANAESDTKKQDHALP